MRKIIYTAAAVAALCAPLTACGGGGGGSTPTHTPTAVTTTVTPSRTAPQPTASTTPPSTPTHTPTHSKAKAKETGEGAISDGKYKVGTDLPAGTYTTKGPGSTDPLKACYFERAKNDSGSIDSILDNDIVSGPYRTTVHTGEYLTLTGGCFWQHVL
jgi:hypothetical protein